MKIILYNYLVYLYLKLNFKKKLKKKQKKQIILILILMKEETDNWNGIHPCIVLLKFLKNIVGCLVENGVNIIATNKAGKDPFKIVLD